MGITHRCLLYLMCSRTDAKKPEIKAYTMSSTTKKRQTRVHVRPSPSLSLSSPYSFRLPSSVKWKEAMAIAVTLLMFFFLSCAFFFFQIYHELMNEEVVQSKQNGDVRWDVHE